MGSRQFGRLFGQLRLVFCLLFDLYIIKCIQRFTFFLVGALALARVSALEGWAEGVQIIFVVGHFAAVVEGGSLEFAHTEHGVLGTGG